MGIAIRRDKLNHISLIAVQTSDVRDLTIMVAFRIVLTFPKFTMEANSLQMEFQQL